jgi:hypothetical protein
MTTQTPHPGTCLRRSIIGWATVVGLVSPFGMPLASIR